jgi:uracil phosphoribosyltransferase
MSSLPHKPNVISNHPLIIDKLTRARQVSTNSNTFRDLIGQITALLLYEASASICLKPKTVQTPLSDKEGQEIKPSIAILPIMRAGLIMSDVASQFFPEAPIVHLGFQRDEKTLEATNYYTGRLQNPSASTCIVMDPMLATGSTASAACSAIESWGVSNLIFIGVIGAPEGVSLLQRKHPDLAIHLGAIDSHLDKRGYIIPGLGDAGDRLFGTT